SCTSRYEPIQVRASAASISSVVIDLSVGETPRGVTPRKLFSRVLLFVNGKQVGAAAADAGSLGGGLSVVVPRSAFGGGPADVEAFAVTEDGGLEGMGRATLLAPE